MFTHRHADGGFYTLVGAQSGKHPESGEWLDGICYKGIDGELHWTTTDRWADRFEELPQSRFQKTETVKVEDDEDEVIASFIFNIDEIDDIRHMMITAGPGAGKKTEVAEYIKRVLKTQAEFISLGLHIRDTNFPDLIGDVNAFHAKFKQVGEHYGVPRMLEPDLFDFRVKFHNEETTEYSDEQVKLVDAYYRDDHREIVNSLELQLDALCDAVWVLLGTADLQFGKKVFYEAWRRVVRANMAKVLATEDPNAKDSGRDVKYDIRKPEGWTPPDHRDLVQDYLRISTVSEPQELEYNGTVQEVAHHPV